MLLRCNEAIPSMGQGPPKKRISAVVEAAPAEEVAMIDYDLKVMSVPPERSSGESSVVVPFPGGQGCHAYECWCDACLATLITRWKEFHPDETMLPKIHLKKPVVPFV